MSRKQPKYIKSTEELVPLATLKGWQKEQEEEVKNRFINIKPRTENQKKLITSLLTNVISFVVGCAGTGKTTICCAIGAKLLNEGKVNQLILTRPQVEVGNNTKGYLPGTYEEKLLPYMLPMIGILKDYLGDRTVDKLIKDKIIQIIPLGLLRGYSFKSSYILCDESQDLSYIEAKTLLTRIDENSRLVISGDTDQIDIAGRNDLEAIMNKLSDLHEEIGFIKLGLEDIQRAGIIRKILERL